MGLVEMVPDVLMELGKQERSAFLATALVPDWVLNLNFVNHSAIVQLDEQRISDRAFFRIMVLNTEALVLDAINLGAERIDARVSGRLVRAAVVKTK